jgi:hypothetical protein
MDWFVRVTEASEPLLQLVEAKPCAGVVINIWWRMDGLVRVIQCILRWQFVYQQRVLDSCVRESLKEPTQWFHQDRLPWTSRRQHLLPNSSALAKVYCD